MSVVVKAYLTRPGQADEIRRFAVDHDVSSNFDYLAGKIAEIYPSLGRGGFKLYWIDDEGDRISFSSDNELMLALGSMKGEVFKVYVTLDQNQSQGSSSAKVHPGVVCDGCEAPVVGNRYKCAVCPDYDLCQTCENRGLHKEHFMMRIADPCTQGFPFPGPHCFGMPPPSAEGPPSCGRGPWARPSRCGRGRSGGRGRFFQHWMKWMHGEHPAQQRNRGDEQAKDEGKEETTSAGPGQAQGQGQFNPRDYLKNVGETVAAMLDPLGIDVQVDVRHNEQNKQDEDLPKENAEETQGTEEQPIDVDRTEGNATPTSMPMETGQNWTVVDMVESLPGQTPTAPEPAEPQGAMAYPPAGPQGAMACPPAEPQSAVAYPPTPPVNSTPQGIYPSLAPNVDAALVKMKEMGYSDDGGWLTQLLITKNGDISKVLDVLSPANQPEAGQRV